MDNLIEKLKKEAPETLKKPLGKDFDAKEAYLKALNQYEKLGHWATPSPDLSNEDKALYKKYNRNKIISSVSKYLLQKYASNLSPELTTLANSLVGKYKEKLKKAKKIIIN